MRRNANVCESAVGVLGELDLIAYARKHRYRLRNLHNGSPVPPARRVKPRGETPTAQAGYVGKDDRYDAIVGYNGYICDEGNGQLGIFLHYKSSMGVTQAERRIKTMDGTVKQVGDTEIAGIVSVDRIEEALRMIKVSKLSPGNPNARPPARSSEPHTV